MYICMCVCLCAYLFIHIYLYVSGFSLVILSIALVPLLSTLGDFIYHLSLGHIHVRIHIFIYIYIYRVLYIFTAIEY